MITNQWTTMSVVYGFAGVFLLLAAPVIGQSSSGERDFVLVLDAGYTMTAKVPAIRNMVHQLASSAGFIRRYILVTFQGAAGTEQVVVSQSPLELLLGLPRTFGGSECRADSLSALQRGLDAAAENPIVLVVTDSPARDSYLRNTVKKLVHRKYAQVNFIVVGACSRGGMDYERLAEVSSGTLWRVNESDFSNAVELFTGRVQTEPSSVTFVDQSWHETPQAGFRRLMIPVDRSVSRLTVDVRCHKSHSGGRLPTLSIRFFGFSFGPASPQTMHTTIDMVSKVVEAPKAGEWKIYAANLAGRCQLLIRGESSTKFLYLWRSSMGEKTSGHPMHGEDSYLIIKGSPQLMSRLTSVEVLNMTGAVLVNWTADQANDIGMPGDLVSKAFGPWLASQQSVKVKVNSRTADAYPIMRIASPAFQHFTAESKEPELAVSNVIQQDQRREVAVGSSITMTCLDPPDFNVQWLKDLNPLALSARHVVRGSTLRLSLMKKTDEGRYSCKLNGARSGNAVIMTTTDVVVTDSGESKPMFTSQSAVRAVGDCQDLLCEVEGKPMPVISWMLNSTALDMSQLPENVRIYPNDTLRICRPTPRQNGNYMCIAENRHGYVRRSYQISAGPALRSSLQAPRIHQGTVTNSGGCIRLPCSATGSPKPTISWLKDDVKITGRMSEYVLLPDGSLQICNVKPQHEGQFVCKAKNSKGMDIVHMELRLEARQGKDDVPMSKPTITADSLIASKDMKSGCLVFPCKAMGSPEPAIDWLYGNKPLLANENLKNGVGLLPDGSLRLCQKSDRLNGFYTCQASSLAGSDARSIALMDAGGMVPSTAEDEISSLHRIIERQTATIESLQKQIEHHKEQWKVCQGERLSGNGNVLVNGRRP